jgi:hypothetical protein
VDAFSDRSHIRARYDAASFLLAFDVSQSVPEASHDAIEIFGIHHLHAFFGTVVTYLNACFCSFDSVAPFVLSMIQIRNAGWRLFAEKLCVATCGVMEEQIVPHLFYFVKAALTRLKGRRPLNLSHRR